MCTGKTGHLRAQVPWTILHHDTFAPLQRHIQMQIHELRKSWQWTTLSCCKALAMTGWLDVCSWRRVISPSMDCWKAFLWIMRWADCVTTSKRLSTWEENQASGLKTDQSLLPHSSSIPSRKSAPTSGLLGQQPSDQRAAGKHSRSHRARRCGGHPRVGPSARGEEPHGTVWAQCLKYPRTSSNSTLSVRSLCVCAGAARADRELKNRVEWGRGGLYETVKSQDFIIFTL